MLFQRIEHRLQSGWEVARPAGEIGRPGHHHPLLALLDEGLIECPDDPAHDIPLPAREIFKRIWIRPLPDAAGPLVELLPLANPESGQALNMTHCALRGASVMYTEYLANMGVAASLTMPIMRDGELWGLIACHHATPVRFPYPVRAACELLAQVASLQLKSAEHTEQLAYRLKLEHVHHQLVARSAREGDLLALTAANHPSLLDAIDAGGAAVYHADRWW